MGLMVCVVCVISCIGWVLFIAAACCLQVPCIMQADAGRTAGSLRTPRPRHSELSSILWLCACIYASNRVRYTFDSFQDYSSTAREKNQNLQLSFEPNVSKYTDTTSLHACMCLAKSQIWYASSIVVHVFLFSFFIWMALVGELIFKNI